LGHPKTKNAKNHIKKKKKKKKKLKKKKKKKEKGPIKWADLFWSAQYRYPTQLSGLTQLGQPSTATHFSSPSRIKKKKK